MPPRQTDLSDAELEVLKALWDLGPTSVRDVMNHLHAQGRELAYTTVLTFLTRLKAKKYVTSKKSGQAYIYKARVSREKVTGTRLSSLIEQLFDGASAPLVLHLVQSNKLSPDEIGELRRMLEDLDAASSDVEGDD